MVAGLAAAALTLVLVARATALPENLLFFWPSRDPGPVPSGAMEIELDGPTPGSRLHAWVFSPADAGAGERLPVVIHVHGNAGAIDSHTAFCAWLAERTDMLRARVVVFDYRGYGRSSEAGYLTRRTLIEDAKAASRAVRAQPWADPERVVLFGNSIGAVTAINAAAELAAEGEAPRAVVAAAPFASWPGVAGFHAGVLGRVLIRSGSDAEEAAGRLGAVPLLTLHGMQDTVTPPGDSARIAAAAERGGAEASTRLYEGLDHVTLLLDEGVRAEVSAWIAGPVGESGVVEAVGD
jgi:dipeptidyl aminopeptidase/acylaminoacyl peptidase